MNRLLSRLIRPLAALAACLSLAAVAEPPPDALTEAQAQFEVRLLKRALTTLHPATTKYLSPEQWAAALARFETRGNAARSAREMFLAATELAAAIRCGHTWTNPLNQAGAIKAQLDGARDKLPLRLTLVESRWLVLASAAPGVAAGDELLAIDGVAGPDIVRRIWPYLRADGSSDNKRLRQLSHDRDGGSLMDLIWPLLSPPAAGRYRLDIRRADGRTLSVDAAAMTLADRDTALAGKGAAAEPVADAGWTLAIRDGVATLTLPTFSVWRSHFDWKRFLADAFARIEHERVGQLIIDIRSNEGGDGAINRTLMSHLLQAPFTWPESRPLSAYERVPYVLVKYLDTWDYGFFDRTGRGELLPDGRYALPPRSAAERTITPVAAPFRGKAWLLVGGENSSATFQLAWLAKLSGAATLVGQATGGNLRGLNGGELLWVTLPHSGVAVDIPLLASIPTVPQPDAPVQPDIEVRRTFAATAAARDQEVEVVMAAIATGVRP